jgi:hypothetical protein
MIEARCPDCGYRFKVGEEVEGLSAECPHCAAEVMVPSLLKVELPVNQTIPPPVRERTVAAMPVAQPQRVPPPPAPPGGKPKTAAEGAASAQPGQAPPPLPGASGDAAAPPTANDGALSPAELAIAQEDHAVWQQLHAHARLPDAIAPPARSFAAEALRSGPVVLSGVNSHMLGRVLIADFVLLIDVFFLVMARESNGPSGIVVKFLFGLLTPFVALLPVCWHCGAALQICAAACGGQDEETAVHIISEGVWEDLFRPTGRMLAAVAISLLPRWMYLLFVAFAERPLPPSLEAAGWGLSLFLFPATLLLIVLGDSIKALSPAKVLHLIVAAPGAYLAVWAAMAALCAVIYGAFALARRALAEHGLAFVVGLYLAMVLISVAFLVAMRVIGLLYRHFKAKLPFKAE